MCTKHCRGFVFEKNSISIFFLKYTNIRESKKKNNVGNYITELNRKKKTTVGNKPVALNDPFAPSTISVYVSFRIYIIYRYICSESPISRFTHYKYGRITLFLCILWWPQRGTVRGIFPLPSKNQLICIFFLNFILHKFVIRVSIYYYNIMKSHVWA